MTKRVSVESTAEAYLELLAARGIDYFFGNAGTDFAPIIEAYARRSAQGQHLPRPLTIPHEVIAVGMAHGYTMVTGRPQVVMVHVIVGAANALVGIINAARCHVPMLFSAGRNPITEAGMRGSRDRHIHWAQESFDQAGMAREYVKWDYELRNFPQLETVVDRALAIAQTEPAGPVYLTLPREVLAEAHEHFDYAPESRAPQAGETVAAPEPVAQAARLLADARNPLIIVKAAGRDPRAVAALARLAETAGAGVVEMASTYLNLSQDHPLHAGFDSTPHLAEADAIVVIESDAPWIPSIKQPRPEARLIQIGIDPLFSRYPIRGFGADVALAGAPRLTMAALADALVPMVDAAAADTRRQRWAAENAKRREGWAAGARKVSTDAPLDMMWVSRCVGELVDDRTIVVNEYDLDQTQAVFRKPGSFFASPQSGGLGWGMGAALGAKLAAPDHTVICCVGDGSYMFGAPTAAHFVSRAHGLPVLYVIFNNRAWNAVKRAVRSLAPEGWTARAGSMALTDLEPSPDYEMVCQAS
ncbi:MAG TPA: thiamine pyrophosphate-requiring protein, partial [Candidatus Limnocylindrales bacterium]|nr:thiamine pyrophosphate-requiring protein [Candidatus Limnocylindrales bacterium]